MSLQTQGCGSGNCQCAGAAQSAVPPSINGIALHEPGEPLAPDEIKERAWSELLRQEAIRQGTLPRRNLLNTPELSPDEQQAIERMLDDAVQVPTPDDETCRRYYEANKAKYVDGQQMHLRHILFAVTDGVDVQKLAAKAEEVLLELARKDAPPGLFAQRARELSNCPSGAQGGDLGWLGPNDCAAELARELFMQTPLPGIGMRQRLVHTRYGLHILEVLGREDGVQLAFDAVRRRIAMVLSQQSRATALHQYIRLLAGAAVVEGVELEAADTPLVQ